MVKVWRLPFLQEHEARTLYENLASAALSVKGLGIHRNQIACLFPKEALAFGLSCEILLEIIFFDIPEWADPLGDRLKKKLANTLKDTFPKARIGCFAYPVITSHGCALERV